MKLSGRGMQEQLGVLQQRKGGCKRHGLVTSWAARLGQEGTSSTDERSGQLALIAQKVPLLMLREDLLTLLEQSQSQSDKEGTTTP